MNGFMFLQMLLDTQAVKTILLEIPALGRQVSYCFSINNFHVFLPHDRYGNSSLVRKFMFVALNPSLLLFSQLNIILLYVHFSRVKNV